MHGATSRSPSGGLALSSILSFWLPLAATWLMMSAEGPYVAAIIARMPEASFNLAAYGVAFSLAWLVESPIMMLLTASNTLVRDRQSFLALRRFAYRMNAAVTALMLVGVAPPVFRFLTGTVMGLPPGVAGLVHMATVILIPWPGSIGYRRFYQGLLVRRGLTRRVAYGTVVRLVTMSATAATLALTTSIHGSTIGAIALVSGVIAEAAASRWMARQVVADLEVTPGSAGSSRLTQLDILRFYYPLALTSIIALVTGPLLTFFMGRSRAPIESLAVMPVVQSLVFLFRSGGIAYQEVGIALVGRRGEHGREVGRGALVLASGATVALALMLFTPLADAWLHGLSGLSGDLARFALTPARILLVLPAMEYWLSFQRCRFILGGKTRVVTVATAIEVSGIAVVMFACVGWLGMVGVVAATIAQIIGRLGSNLFLLAASRLAAVPASSVEGPRA